MRTEIENTNGKKINTKLKSRNTKSKLDGHTKKLFLVYLIILTNTGHSRSNYNNAIINRQCFDAILLQQCGHIGCTVCLL